MKRIAILGSTRGSNLEPLHASLVEAQIDAQIVQVISNQPNAGILQRAKALSIPNLCIPSKGISRLEHEQQVNAELNQIDLLILLGYMRILSADFTQQWFGEMINVHPSLLPKHQGLMDLAVHQAVLDAKEVESGCSVHLVTEQVDAGKVLVQKTCPVFSDDTAQSLKQRVQALEVPALILAIRKLT